MQQTGRCGLCSESVITMNTDSAAGTQAKVLVVDDEPAILITLKKILQHSGYEVQTAQSGREGLDAFQQGTWDLVTLDRSMPEMNGETVALKMRQIAPHVPIILITGFPNAVLRRDLFDAVLGVTSFQTAELLQSFTQALGKHAGGGSQLPESRMAGCICD